MTRLTIFMVAALLIGGTALAQQPAAKAPTLEELETRARQDSLDPEAHFRLAMRTLEQAAAANPRDPRTIYHLGVVQHKLARAPQARESLARFVGMAPAAKYERGLSDAKQRLGSLGQ